MSRSTKVSLVSGPKIHYQTRSSVPSGDLHPGIAPEATSRTLRRLRISQVMPAPRRLLIDARPPVDGAALNRRLLGLGLIERLVLAAREASFDDVRLLVADDVPSPAALGRVADTPRERTTPPTDIATAIVPADLLGAVGWLRELRSQPVKPGETMAGPSGLHLVGTGAATEEAPRASFTLERAPMTLGSDQDLKRAERHLLNELRKETDGFMSRHFARPISINVSRHLARGPITPNAMTVISTLIGLAAAPFFLSTEAAVQVWGGVLLVLHSVLDGCDGELARLKFEESRFGGLLDFAGDNLVHVAVFACMALGWAEARDAAWPIWFGLAAVVGTAGSAVTVYWLTLRKKQGTGPVYTSVTEGPSSRLSRLLDALSRRDFIYLVLALAAFGKAAWFVALAGIGAPLFLGLVLVASARTKDRARA